MAGDMVRRLVTRTIAQQIRGHPHFNTRCQRGQALNASRAAIQAIIDADTRATVLPADGISAYDIKSRVATVQGLRSMKGSDPLLPFVSQFCGSPSTYLGR